MLDPATAIAYNNNPIELRALFCVCPVKYMANPKTINIKAMIVPLTAGVVTFVSIIC